MDTSSAVLVVMLRGVVGCVLVGWVGGYLLACLRFRRWLPFLGLWVEVGQMERIPKGYGVAWVRWDRRSVVCLPIGVHLVASWVRAGWFWFRVYRAPDVLALAQEQAFQAGFSSGRATERAYAESDFTRRREEIERRAVDDYIDRIMAGLKH